MNNELRAVDIELQENVVRLLKDSTSMFLSDLYQMIIIYSLQERTPEDNLMLLEKAERLKKEIFEGVLDSYNDFIKDKNLLDYYLSRKNEEQKIIIETMNNDMVKTGMIALGVTIILPILSPITFMVSVPRMGLDALNKSIAREVIEIIKEIKDDYDSIQRDYYKFVDSLRADYYQSKKKIKALKEQAKEGKEVIDELLKIVNPEVLNLPLVDYTLLQDTEEKPKQFVK